MEAEFIRGLSPRSKHFRALAAVNEVPLSDVRRLCEVDGTQSVAFVATVRRTSREEAIGVSRYAPMANTNAREIAITVADEWQQKGLGAVLVTHLIEYAKAKGVKQLCAIDLVNNAGMHALAKHLGMSATPDPGDPYQTIYSLAL
jgi:GNAT superfamily N-acetyltransferase